MMLVTAGCQAAVWADNFSSPRQRVSAGLVVLPLGRLVLVVRGLATPVQHV